MIKITKTTVHKTAEQVAKEQGVSLSRIQLLLKNRRIAGATKHGRDWLIPAGYTILPSDKKRGPQKFLKMRKPSHD